MQIDHPTTDVTESSSVMTETDLSGEVEAIYREQWSELEHGLTINYKSSGSGTVTLFESEVDELYRFLDKQLNETDD